MMLTCQVPTKLESWSVDHHPRRASVNSFGYGGSNVHVILEEAPDITGDGSEPKSTNGNLNAQRKLLCLSANHEAGIERQARLLAEYLRSHPALESMDDLVYTLGQRRSIHKHRFAVQSDSIRGMQSNLEKLTYNPPKAGGVRRLAFVFTGQGAQWPRMGCELLVAYPVFRDSFKAAEEHLRNLGAKWSLLGMLIAFPLN